jgi:hypothetical protein
VCIDKCYYLITPNDLFLPVSREFLSRVSRVGQESARDVIIEKVYHAQHLLVERSLRQLQILDIEF